MNFIEKMFERDISEDDVEETIKSGKKMKCVICKHGETKNGTEVDIRKFQTAA